VECATGLSTDEESPRIGMKWEARKNVSNCPWLVLWFSPWYALQVNAWVSGYYVVEQSNPWIITS